MVFSLFKKKKNVFQIIGLSDIYEIFKNSHEEIKTERFIDLNSDISKLSNIFNVATFKIFNNEPKLDKNISFNLILENKIDNINKSELSSIVNKLSSEYGNDRRGNSKWTYSDENSLETFWVGREWIIDQKGKSHKTIEIGYSQINLHYLDGELSLSILGANNLL